MMSLLFITYEYCIYNGTTINNKGNNNNGTGLSYIISLLCVYIYMLFICVNIISSIPVIVLWSSIWSGWSHFGCSLRFGFCRSCFGQGFSPRCSGMGWPTKISNMGPVEWYHSLPFSHIVYFSASETILYNIIYIYVLYVLIIEGSLEVKLPTLWTDESRAGKRQREEKE